MPGLNLKIQNHDPLYLYKIYILAGYIETQILSEINFFFEGVRDWEHNIGFKL